MDSSRPAYRLQPNARVAAAAVILFVGILAALLFRSEVSPVPPTETDATSPVVERETHPVAAHPVSTTIEAEPQDSRPHLTGTIEPSPEKFDVPADNGLSNSVSDDNDPGAAASWRVTDLGSTPLPGGAGLVPRDPATTAYGSRLTDEARRTHTIVDGDTLFYLAEKYLGDGERYLQIYEANRDVLTDPDLLVLGAVLRIPPADSAPLSADEQLAEAAKSGGLVPVSTAATAPVATSTPTAPLTEVSRPVSAPPPATTLGAPAPLPSTTNVSVDSASFTRPQTYRVRSGDTLVDIARRVYGDARRYLDIYDANRDRLRRPQDLREGLILTIPQ